MAAKEKVSESTFRRAKATDTPQKIFDGGGLFMLISPSGGKLWRLAYRYGGKQKTLALGAYPEVTLEMARERRTKARRLLAEGIDPGVQKKLDKLAKKIAETNTFDAVADEFLAKCEREGLAASTMGKKRWLLSLALPDIGKRPIGEILPAEILVPLKRIEAKENYETAIRLRAVLGQVFRYGVAATKLSSDPTRDLRGALTTPHATSRAAIVDAEGYKALVRAVWGYDGYPLTRYALRLMCLLYPRPGELRCAEWAEFDFETAIWRIPVGRMKMRREHVKPLSPLAIEVLRDVQRISGNGRLAFPATHSTLRPMSENTLNTALRRLGFSKDEATSHGFRSSASSLLNESGLWNSDAIERELSHADPDEVRGIYNRSAYWDERVRMAGWWAGQIKSMVES